MFVVKLILVCLPRKAQLEHCEQPGKSLFEHKIQPNFLENCQISALFRSPKSKKMSDHFTVKPRKFPDKYTVCLIT